MVPLLLLFVSKSGLVEVQFLLIHLKLRKLHFHSSYLTCKDLFFSMSSHFYILPDTQTPRHSPALTSMQWPSWDLDNLQFQQGLCLQSPAEADLGFIVKVYGKTLTGFLTPVYPFIWLLFFYPSLPRHVLFSYFPSGLFPRFFLFPLTIFPKICMLASLA